MKKLLGSLSLWYGISKTEIPTTENRTLELWSKAIFLLAFAVTVITGNAFAATTQTQSANVSVASLISIEFANTTDTTFGGGAIPWTSIDPTSNLVYPTGHVSTKADTAVICKYNGSNNWALRMKFNSTNGLDGKLKYYMAMPFYNGVAANGTLGNPVPGSGSDWPVVPTSDLTVYTCGTADRTNVPFGTFVGVSYGLNPTGLSAGTSYSGTITYTVVGGL